MGEFTSEDIRNIIRTDKTIKFIVRGLSFVFVYDAKDDYQPPTNIEGIEQYIIGSKSIVSMIEALPDFNLNLNSAELSWPDFENHGDTDVNNRTNTIGISVEQTTIMSNELDDNMQASKEENPPEQTTSSKTHYDIENKQKFIVQVVSNEEQKQSTEGEKETDSDDDNEEGENVSVAVKRVVNYHKHRAKVLKFLFTPNAVRISLAAEMGLNGLESKFVL